MITHIIFDLDETLLDTLPLWRKAETRLCEYLGGEFSGELASCYKGMSAKNVVLAIIEHLGADRARGDEAMSKLREYLLEEYNTKAAPMPGAGELLERLKGRFPLAVASGSPLEGIRAALEPHAWLGYFEQLVSSEEVEHGKPAPDVFIETAKRLAAEAKNCLVIEDSVNGLAAAKAAGMRCFVVPSLRERAAYGAADGIFASLAEIDGAALGEENA